ncbi:MAG: putative oxidoreductase, partial [Friedmanniella sp.]|nr:putative oxidoreductase [Friedmanniella sp.]
MHQRSADADTASRTATRRWARVSGVVSGVAGLAVADLASWLIAPAASPVPAVGELIIKLLPAPLVNFGKDSLGTADKPILVTIIVVALLLVFALAGQREHRRPWGGALVFGVLAVVAVVAVTVRTQADPAAYVPTVVGLLVGYMLLSTLITRLRRWQPTRSRPRDEAEQPTRSRPGDEAEQPARRSFLRWTAVAGGLAVVGAVAGQVLVNAANRVSA